MKFSLPAFPLRKKGGDSAAGPDAASAPVAAPIKGGQQASLGRVRILLLAAGVLLTGVLSLIIFQFMSTPISRAIEQDVEKTTEQVAASIATLVDVYRSSMGLLAKDPAIAELLMSSDSTGLRKREESLGYLFPDAINIQLLLPDISEVNNAVSPPLGYAALAQIREAENSETATPAEVHLFNTPQQHINIVQRVMDPAGSGVVGYLMLSLSGETLKQILGSIRDAGGYVELQQVGAKGAPVRVSGHGDTQYKDGEPDAVRDIGGSRWQVAYWSSQGTMEYLGNVGLGVTAAFLVTAVLMVLLVLVLFKRLFAALQQDQISLVTLLKDYRDQQVRREYASGLKEMEETLLFMTKLASTHQAREESATAPREQDAEYTSEAEPEEQKEDVDREFGDMHTGELIVEEENPLDIQTGPDGAVTIDPSIFRAYDIRGVVNQTLTPAAVRQIGRAIGSEALQRGRQTVIVGRDGRLSGPALSEALIAGLVDTGCSVKDIGVAPTPVLYFAAHYLDTQTGVMVTGSHNPPDYNGLKIMIDGETLSGESIQHLRERIETENFIAGEGRVENINVIPDYIERIRSDVSIPRQLKIVVDCGNGVAGAVIPQLLRELGCDVIELFCEVDGNFPNHHPDPSKPENLKDLIATVEQQQADIGLAFDGDGDRLGVVNTRGSIIWPDRILMLFAMDILERNPGGLIIYDVKCSRYLDGIISQHGGKPLMWKTGHSFIKAKIQETGALLAGEMSGHIFFKERWFGFDDGLYAAARLLEVLGKDERSVTEIFASLPDSVNTPELNISMQEGEPQKYIERLLSSAHFDGARMSTIDGLRADFEDGWGLVRASNTTPVLVLRFEADNEIALRRIMEEFRRVMLQVDPGLELPF
jgi:phosphomannomutase/phosphoglucomutase